jgi:hypothetical protein
MSSVGDDLGKAGEGLVGFSSWCFMGPHWPRPKHLDCAVEQGPLCQSDTR